jgi:hypothetical protein
MLLVQAVRNIADMISFIGWGSAHKGLRNRGKRARLRLSIRRANCKLRQSGGEEV